MDDPYEAARRQPLHDIALAQVIEAMSPGMENASFNLEATRKLMVAAWLLGAQWKSNHAN